MKSTSKFWLFCLLLASLTVVLGKKIEKQPEWQRENSELSLADKILKPFLLPDKVFTGKIVVAHNETHFDPNDPCGTGKPGLKDWERKLKDIISLILAVVIGFASLSYGCGIEWDLLRGTLGCDL